MGPDKFVTRKKYSAMWMGIGSAGTIAHDTSYYTTELHKRLQTQLKEEHEEPN